MSQRRIINHLLNHRAEFDDTVTIGDVASTAFLTATQDSLTSNRWSSTLPSAGSRRPSLKGKGSVRGSLIDNAHSREIVFESRLERGMAEMLLARRDIASVLDQPPPVRYIDADGRAHQHTFDFLAVTTDGQRCAIAVKPQAKVQRSRIDAIIQLIQRQVGPQFADRYLLRTDRHITRTRVANARLILRGRRVRNEDDVSAVRAIVSKLAGVFMLADIVATSKSGARGFNALVALIDDGVIHPIGGGRIDYITRARLAPAI